MEEMKRLQIPPFGNWDDCDEMPITQHFESAMQAGLIKGHLFGEDEDLLKVPVASMKQTYHRKVKKGGRGEIKQGIRVYDLTTQSPRKQLDKAVDEDLYKIPPELLYKKTKRKTLLRHFWSGCLGSICAACA